MNGYPVSAATYVRVDELRSVVERCDIEGRNSGIRCPNTEPRSSIFRCRTRRRVPESLLVISGEGKLARCYPWLPLAGVGLVATRTAVEQMRLYVPMGPVCEALADAVRQQWTVQIAQSRLSGALGNIDARNLYNFLPEGLEGARCSRTVPVCAKQTERDGNNLENDHTGPTQPLVWNAHNCQQIIATLIVSRTHLGECASATAATDQAAAD